MDRQSPDYDSDLDSEWSSENNAGANFATFARQLQYDKTNYDYWKKLPYE